MPFEVTHIGTRRRQTDTEGYHGTKFRTESLPEPTDPSA